MDLGIHGKVAVVVGGSRGLGRATARALAAEGVEVVIAARTEGDIDDTVREIRGAGGRAVGATGDMTTRAGIDDAVAAGQAAFGGTPDIAVSTLRPDATDIATGGDGAFEDIDPKGLRSGYEQTVVAYAWLAWAVVPGMRQRGWGRLVNVCSGSVKEPPRELRHLAGNTSRAGVVTLSKSLANELGPYGITVNTIGTGLFDSGHRRAHFAERARALGEDPATFEQGWLATQVPLRRAGSPEEMAAVCTFLCSEGAGYVTGQFLAVDGGFARSAW